MTVVEVFDPRPADSAAKVVRTSRLDGVVLFGTLSAMYFAVGYLLAVRYNMFEGDAPSRVANAGYALMSRDPHVSAIGFVWNPLPSLVEIPVLQLSYWWPELRTHGLAGVVQSSLFMAAAAIVVRGIALDRGVPAGWRRLAVVAFALQPMIVLYGGSGMSEAAETFAVLWCVRHLMRWAQHRDPRDLAGAGLALGLGYLARYEVVPAAIGAAAFVMAATTCAPGHARVTRVLANVAIVLFPIVIAAVVWALSGWVVNQELFATLTTPYGNASLVESAARKGFHTAGLEWLIPARLLGMQPFAGIAVAGAFTYGVVARRASPLIPAATFGPVLAFAAWGQYSSTTFGLFRYFLLAIPMAVCTALACWTPTGDPRPLRRVETCAKRLAAAVICLSIIVGFPVTVRAGLNERINASSYRTGFISLLQPSRFAIQDLPERQMMVNERLLADYFDRQALPDGSVLMDTSNTWGAWLSSRNPRQFVITSDYDFKAALNRPWDNGIRYLVVSNSQVSLADALDLRYPTLWSDGAGFSDLAYEVNATTGEEQFRVYRVTGPPREVAGDRQGPL